MNFENIGKIVAKVVNENDKKKDKIISVSDKTDDLDNPMKKIVLTKSNTIGKRLFEVFKE